MIDSHCHLDHEPLFNNLDDILMRSKDVGIEKLLTICTTFKSFEKIVLKFFPVQLTFIGWMPGSNDVVQSIIARKPFILDKNSKKHVGKCLDVITGNLQKIPLAKKPGIHFFSVESG